MRRFRRKAGSSLVFRKEQELDNLCGRHKIQNGDGIGHDSEGILNAASQR